MATQSHATWIWYPGDFEVWLHREVSLRRWGRDMVLPPVWRLDSPYSSIQFRKQYNLQQSESIHVTAHGDYSVGLDGREGWAPGPHIEVPAGEHVLMISVVNVSSLPALYIEAETLFSDASWEVTCYNKHWLAAAHEDFHNPNQHPATFQLTTTPIEPLLIEREADTILADFGKETFGYLQVQASGNGPITVTYGESRAEALSTEHAEVTDQLQLTTEEETLYTLPSRAFRYVNLRCEHGTIHKVSALYEYLPLTYRGSFRSSNERLNTIYNTSYYTLHLNTREFFLDGIKRDRWVWSGDAYQSALMNYYSFFDEAVTRRTYVALRGKDPIETHINTILDYSFYWFIGIYDYYLYTGDQVFIHQHYKKMLSLLDFCLHRRNTNGFIEGIEHDWVFIDWAPIDNRGEVSTEQLLFCRTLEAMTLFAQLVDDEQNVHRFNLLANELKAKTLSTFWDQAQGCLVHNRFNGQLSQHVTKYPNMFALLFAYLDSEQSTQIKQNVLLNEQVQKITTPYMRFYELAALCEVGEHARVLQEILSYWGGMLDLGATSFWETFDSNEAYEEHTAMYGRPFGRSFCHAWGASPIYLLGKYFLGVRPLSPGYASYLVQPQLGGLSWLEGSVPTPHGDIHVKMDLHHIHITTIASLGYLRFTSTTPPNCNTGTLRSLGDNTYELLLEPPTLEYTINYNL